MISKLYEKGTVDEQYVAMRKNAFLNHLKRTKEKKKWQEEIISKINKI